MLAKIGHKVRDLTRIKFGPLTLHGLAPGQFRELTRARWRELRASANRKPGAGGAGGAVGSEEGVDESSRPKRPARGGKVGTVGNRARQEGEGRQGQRHRPAARAPTPGLRGKSAARHTFGSRSSGRT